MSDCELFDAVAHVTGEDSREIRRRGFTLMGPTLAELAEEQECDISLVELPLPGTVDWDSVLSDESERRYTRPTSRAKKPTRKRAQKVA
jgi:hypothetical protein